MHLLDYGAENEFTADQVCMDSSELGWLR